MSDKEPKIESGRQQGRRAAMVRWALEMAAQGKKVAICRGDDVVFIERAEQREIDSQAALPPTGKGGKG